jgi:uncharacterized BrkB/YihY/UPF0761 family membrane protein
MKTFLVNLLRSLICVLGGAGAAGGLMLLLMAGGLLWQNRASAEHLPEVLAVGLMASAMALAASLPVWVLVFAPCYLIIPRDHPLRQPGTALFLGAFAGTLLLVLGLALFRAFDNSASWLLLPFAAVTGGTAAWLGTKLPRVQDGKPHP